jgi:hypothetical protein
MATSQASGNDHLERSRRGEDSPFRIDEDVAWEPLEGDLWVPHRIRGSWRGGVLG